MKWVKPFAIGYEYVYIPDKVNNLTALRLLTRVSNLMCKN